jgi:alpha-1,3-mannosyltransferase
VAFHACCAVALVWEVVVHVVLFWKARFTHIDWNAYMEQVGTVWNDSQYDYAQIKGDTGPVAYPAGYVYIYTVFYHLTSGGVDLNTARILFSLLYLLNLGVVCSIYKVAVVGHQHQPLSKDKDGGLSAASGKVWPASSSTFPPAAILLLCFSKRIHSIYSLRLFNDTVEVFLAHCSVLLFAKRHWNWGVVLLSAAVSVKMNAVLLLPAVVVILMAHKGLLRSIVSAGLFIGVQLLVAVPFLSANAASYLGTSFNFTRIFKRKWSVNFKWVPCEPLDEELQLEDCSGTFTSPDFSAFLLVLMVTLLLSFFHFQWCPMLRMRSRASGDGSEAQAQTVITGAPSLIAHSLRGFVKELSQGKQSLVILDFSPRQVVLMLFTSNFIGVVCSKSLHFQFYVWYFHSLPLLLWEGTRLPLVIKVALLVLIELCWNPWEGESSSIESSALLTCCHLVFLVALCFGRGETEMQYEQKGLKLD